MLDELVRKASVRDKAGILTLAPFLEEDTLRKVAKALMADGSVTGWKG